AAQDAGHSPGGEHKKEHEPTRLADAEGGDGPGIGLVESDCLEVLFERLAGGSIKEPGQQARPEGGHAAEHPALVELGRPAPPDAESRPRGRAFRALWLEVAAPEAVNSVGEKHQE